CRHAGRGLAARGVVVEHQHHRPRPREEAQRPLPALRTEQRAGGQPPASEGQPVEGPLRHEYAGTRPDELPAEQRPRQRKSAVPRLAVVDQAAPDEPPAAARPQLGDDDASRHRLRPVAVEEAEFARTAHTEAATVEERDERTAVAVAETESP